MPSKPAKDPDRNLYRRGGTYYVRYELGGKERRESLKTVDVKKARIARNILLAELADKREGRATEQPPVAYFWQDAVDGCLRYLNGQAKAGEISQSAVDRYETSIVQITAALEWEKMPDGMTPRPVDMSSIVKATILDFIDARREGGRSTSTILNDMTAWNHILEWAEDREWIATNPMVSIKRDKIGTRSSSVAPPTDSQISVIIEEVAEWSPEMAKLLKWLRETGMRLAEALNLRASDVHPGGKKATLRLGVKRNRGDGGTATRTINLGGASDMLADMPTKGRLFSGLSTDSAVASTRYGQWRRQRKAREEREAAAEGRDVEEFPNFRMHALRHAFAVASLVDDDTCIYRLSVHLGHTKVDTTEIYSGHLRREGADWHYSRKTDLFGSLPPSDIIKARAA